MASDQTTDRTCQEAIRATEWSFRRKLIASVVIGLHVTAVFAAPCASPPPSSYLANWIAGRVEGRQGLFVPYLHAMYLNHGYRFFAPNPGPSHLVRYEIELAGGGQIEGQFPDPEEHWPRLLYHRMFMISETVNSIESPVSEPPPADSVDEQQMQDFRRQRAMADELVQAIARHLMAEYDGQRVRLFLRRHEIAAPERVIEGMEIDDKRLYRERPLGEFAQADL